MKKFLIAAVATSLVASPILAAPPADAQVRHSQQTVKYKNNGRVVVKQRNVTRHDVRQPVRHNYRTNWRKGERFDRGQARNYRPVSNWHQYQNRRLYAPQRGQQWVQSGNDAVLITVATGLIAAVLAGALN